jgi:hypothetical protein
MKAVFADTYFFLALLDSAERRHAEAVKAVRDEGLRLGTTETHACARPASSQITGTYDADKANKYFSNSAVKA